MTPCLTSCLGAKERSADSQRTISHHRYQIAYLSWHGDSPVFCLLILTGAMSRTQTQFSLKSTHNSDSPLRQSCKVNSTQNTQGQWMGSNMALALISRDTRQLWRQCSCQQLLRFKGVCSSKFSWLANKRTRIHLY